MLLSCIHVFTWEFDWPSTVLQTKVTPIVEGYGGWALRMEIVPIESAYPGFGELVVSLSWYYYQALHTVLLVDVHELCS